MECGRGIAAGCVWRGLELSGAPRIAQRGQPPQGVAAINPVMHQEASEEVVHLCAPGGRETGKCLSGCVWSQWCQNNAKRMMTGIGMPRS